MAHTSRESTTSAMPTTPPKLKREASSSDIRTPPSKKHQGSTIAFDNSSQLVHVRASGQRVYPGDLYTGDDALVQSLQQQDAEAAVDGEGSGDVSDGDGESVYEDAQADPHEFDYLRGGGGEEEAEDDDDDDLFAKAFKEESSTPSEDEADDSDLEIIGATNSHGKVNQIHPDYSHHDASEHAAGCKPTRSASTPPPRSKPPKALVVARGVHDHDPIKDLRKSLVQQKRMHLRAKEFKPRIELASHRFWICVLHPKKNLSSIKAEKDFTWMRGNRCTTIQTVHHTYHTTNMPDSDFVLLLGQERVHSKDRCEELDYFNDKFICLRAVNVSGPKDPAGMGRELAEGCPAQEIVDLTD